MTTKTPAKVKEEDPSSPVKIIYTMVDGLKDILPVMNDRYRLGFCLHKYYNGEANSIHEALASANPTSSKLDMKELEKIITEKYNNLKLPPEDK